MRLTPSGLRPSPLVRGTHGEQALRPLTPGPFLLGKGKGEKRAEAYNLVARALGY